MPLGTISRLGVWSDSAPIYREKSSTELNDPHCTELGKLQDSYGYKFSS
jgi:hypothetical protein